MSKTTSYVSTYLLVLGQLRLCLQLGLFAMLRPTNFFQSCNFCGYSTAEMKKPAGGNNLLNAVVLFVHLPFPNFSRTFLNLNNFFRFEY